jgi:transcriptional accessory protein Tex/SPT6
MFAFLRSQLDSRHPQTYLGLITDVRNFGFFVDVTGLGMSGLVPVSGLSDDFYQFEVRNGGQLIGRRTRRLFKLGDKVEIQIAKVDRFKRQVDFKLADNRRPALSGTIAVTSAARVATSHVSSRDRQNLPGSCRAIRFPSSPNSRSLFGCGSSFQP